MGVYVKSKRDFDNAILSNGLSKKALADKIGVTRNYISIISNPENKKSVGIDTAIKIADELGVNKDDIFLFEMFN